MIEQKKNLFLQWRIERTFNPYRKVVKGVRIRPYVGWSIFFGLIIGYLIKMQILINAL